jgi:Family of unknown function (DUF6518)
MQTTMSSTGAATRGAPGRPRTAAVAWIGREVGGGLAALTVGAVLGGLTDAGQTWLPWAASSLANSGGSWVLAAFLIALPAARVRQATAWGGLSMVGLVVGYYLTAAQRGVPVAPSAVEFWVVAALVIGPVVGLTAGWVRRGSPLRVAAAAGVVGGLLVGEALYGLRYIDPWTSTKYWVLQALVGLGLMVGLLAGRARRVWAAPVTLLTAVAVGAATIAAYVHSF